MVSAVGKGIFSRPMCGIGNVEVAVTAATVDSWNYLRNCRFACVHGS